MPLKRAWNVYGICVDDLGGSTGLAAWAAFDCIIVTYSPHSSLAGESSGQTLPAMRVFCVCESEVTVNTA